jgi:hypothetical protein
MAKPVLSQPNNSEGQNPKHANNVEHRFRHETSTDAAAATGVVVPARESLETAASALAAAEMVIWPGILEREELAVDVGVLFQECSQHNGK